MGTELSRILTLESVATLSINIVSRALDPIEREVVCGDLFEAGENGWPALREVLGLVIRRRVLNRDFVRSCVLSIPATLVLTLLALRIADGSAIYLWMWISNSDWEIVQSPGFWNPVIQIAPGLLFPYITLACCSWTCGLMLGRFAGRTRGLSTLFLLATAVPIAVCGFPDALGRILVLQSARDYYGNAAVFVEFFYKRIFPGTIDLFLVMLPAWWGIRESSLIRRLASPARYFLLSLCVGEFCLLVVQNLISPLHSPNFPEIAPVTVLVPIVFLVIRRRRRLRHAWAG